MKKIEVFDPSMCCSTGICGVDVDQTLVTFAADLDWAKQNGVQVERFNLAQQPQVFAENAVVKTLLEHSGQDGLPLILVDGQQVLAGRYPDRNELANWIQEPNKGSLFTPQVAELIAISAAIASHCEPCFKHHYDKARKLGVSVEDMQRAVDLAQHVKDTSAQAVLDLARHYLDSPVHHASAAKDTANASSGCCGSANQAAVSAANGCCT